MPVSRIVLTLRPHLQSLQASALERKNYPALKTLSKLFPLSAKAADFIAGLNPVYINAVLKREKVGLEGEGNFQSFISALAASGPVGKVMAENIQRELLESEVTVRMGSLALKFPILKMRDEDLSSGNSCEVITDGNRYQVLLEKSAAEKTAPAIFPAEAEIAPEIRLLGVAVAYGSAIGNVFQMGEELPSVKKRNIPAGEIAAESARLDSALNLLAAEIAAEMERQGVGDEQRRLKETHLVLLNDLVSNPDFGAKKMLDECLGAEYAVYLVIQNLKDVYAANDFTRHVVPDLLEAGYRLLGKLGVEFKSAALPQGDDPVILVVNEILSSRLTQILASPGGKKIVGLVMEGGSARAHIAFLLKDLNLPAVFAVNGATKMLPDGKLVALQADASSGSVLLNPRPETIESLQSEAAKRRLYRERVTEDTRGKPAITKDHDPANRVTVRIGANNNDLNRLGADIAAGAERFGLVRLEHVFCGRLEVPTEEELYAYLRGITVPATVRLTDFAEDKVPEPPLVQEIWGVDGKTYVPVGGIRILFTHEGIKILKIQLRAILRAWAEGADLQILLPMITGPRHPGWIRELVKECKLELFGPGGAQSRKIKIGAMIELPSAVWNREEIAQVVDFFSIGTNDLEQNTFGVSRGNPFFTRFVDRFHPGLLKQLKAIADCGQKNNIPVSVCGGMAADPLGVLYLMGIGISELSMPVPDIPFIKYLIRSVKASNCRIFAERLLAGHSQLKVGERDRNQAAAIAKDIFPAEALEHIYWMAGAGV